MSDGAYQIGGTMLGLSDLEITRDCAEAMGISLMPHEEGDERCFIRKTDSPHALYPTVIYWPLDDDAQCFALVKKFGLDVQHGGGNSNWWRVIKFASLDSTKRDIDSEGVDLNRAICLCVAKMQEGR